MTCPHNDMDYCCVNCGRCSGNMSAEELTDGLLSDWGDGPTCETCRRRLWEPLEEMI